jgi:signal transduction histidine kinase
MTGDRPGTDAAASGIWLWDALFLVSAAIGAALVAAADEPAAERVTAAALVLGIGGAWLVAGRRLAVAETPDDRPAVLGYATLLVAGLTGAVLLVPDSTWALFVLVPQMYWLLRLARAVALTVVLIPGLSMVAALAAGDTAGEAVRDLGPQALFLTALAVVVGVWIHRVTDQSDDRARLVEQLTASRSEVAALSHDAGVAAERERLAGEIHDTLAQGFTSIVTLLQAAQAEFDTDDPAARRHVALAVAVARENLDEARHLVASSAPGALAIRSLVDAVGRQVERFTDETAVAAECATSGPPRRLPVEHEVVVLRAAQELLANAARHARAAAVTVRLDFTDPSATALTVADDGTGFDPAATPAGSYGLAMMEARVRRMGGTMTVDSTPGEGTRVTVRVPG